MRQKVGNDAINVVADITLGRNRGGWSKAYESGEPGKRLSCASAWKGGRRFLTRPGRYRPCRAGVVRDTAMWTRKTVGRRRGALVRQKSGDGRQENRATGLCIGAALSDIHANGRTGTRGGAKDASQTGKTSGTNSWLERAAKGMSRRFCRRPHRWAVNGNTPPMISLSAQKIRTKESRYRKFEQTDRQ